MLEADFQVLQQRNLRTGLVVKGDGLLQDAEIAGFPDIGHGAEDEPQRVVVETAANVVVAALGKGLVLMVTTAVRELGRSNVDDALAGPFRNHMHDTGKVLVGIPETHAPADAALEVAGAPAEEEGNHALILVPDIHRAVQFRDLGFHAEAVQKVVPKGPKLREGGIDLRPGRERVHHFQRLCLVDDAGGDELLVGGILHVAQHKNEFFFLPRLQGQVQAVRGNGAPAMGHGIARGSGKDLLRRLKAIVHADECLPVCVEAVEGTVYAKEGIMVPAFPVFGLVIQHVPFHLYLSGRKVALEVFHIGRGVPKAPLGKRV